MARKILNFGIIIVLAVATIGTLAIGLTIATHITFDQPVKIADHGGMAGLEFLLQADNDEEFALQNDHQMVFLSNFERDDLNSFGQLLLTGLLTNANFKIGPAKIPTRYKNNPEFFANMLAFYIQKDQKRGFWAADIKLWFPALYRSISRQEKSLYD